MQELQLAVVAVFISWMYNGLPIIALARYRHRRSSGVQVPSPLPHPPSPLPFPSLMCISRSDPLISQPSSESSRSNYCSSSTSCERLSHQTVFGNFSQYLLHLGRFFFIFSHPFLYRSISSSLSWPAPHCNGLAAAQSGCYIITIHLCPSCKRIEGFFSLFFPFFSFYLLFSFFSPFFVGNRVSHH